MKVIIIYFFCWAFWHESTIDLLPFRSLSMNKYIKLLLLTAFYSSFIKAQESTLSVNNDQHSVYMDGDDEIEDLSEDAYLDEFERIEKEKE